jgi:hypothetical protein
MKKIVIVLMVLAMAACAEKKGQTNGSSENQTPAENAASPDAITNPATPENPSATSDPANAPILTFENTHVTLGTINEGESVEVIFSFKNTGNAPLLLHEVQPGCGCTVANDWPKDTPIAPGAKGKIKATFNSEGKGTGAITKSIHVKSNTPYPNDVIEVKFSVNVNPKKG